MRVITGCKIMLGQRYYFETLKRGENKCALFTEDVCNDCIRKTTCKINQLCDTILLSCRISERFLDERY